MDKYSRQREQAMLKRCVNILYDYNILSVNDSDKFHKDIAEMPK